MPHDYRLVAARSLVWLEPKMREPGRIALTISGLENFIAEGPESAELSAEAENLLRKLRKGESSCYVPPPR